MPDTTKGYYEQPERWPLERPLSPEGCRRRFGTSMAREVVAAIDLNGPGRYLGPRASRGQSLGRKGRPFLRCNGGVRLAP